MGQGCKISYNVALEYPTEGNDAVTTVTATQRAGDFTNLQRLRDPPANRDGVDSLRPERLLLQVSTNADVARFSDRGRKSGLEM